MTRAYLESAISSKSSMGGLVMPSGLATMPDTRCPSVRRLRAQMQQLYQFVTCLLDGLVDHHRVELWLGGQLQPGPLQPGRRDLGRFGTPTSEPADEFVPRR